MEGDQLGQEEAAAGATQGTHRLRPLQGHAIEEAEAIRGPQGSREGSGLGIKSLGLDWKEERFDGMVSAGRDGILEGTVCMNFGILAC